jgi:hypothetical protein
MHQQLTKALFIVGGTTDKHVQDEEDSFTLRRFIAEAYFRRGSKHFLLVDTLGEFDDNVEDGYIPSLTAMTTVYLQALEILEVECANAFTEFVLSKTNQISKERGKSAPPTVLCGTGQEGGGEGTGTPPPKRVAQRQKMWKIRRKKAQKKQFEDLLSTPVGADSIGLYLKERGGPGSIPTFLFALDFRKLSALQAATMQRSRGHDVGASSFPNNSNLKSQIDFASDEIEAIQQFMLAAYFRKEASCAMFPFFPDLQLADMTMPPFETLCTMYDEILKRIFDNHYRAYLKSDYYSKMKVDSVVHSVLEKDYKEALEDGKETQATVQILTNPDLVKEVLSSHLHPRLYPACTLV